MFESWKMEATPASGFMISGTSPQPECGSRTEQYILPGGKTEWPFNLSEAKGKEGRL